MLSTSVNEFAIVSRSFDISNNGEVSSVLIKRVIGASAPEK